MQLSKQLAYSQHLMRGDCGHPLAPKTLDLERLIVDDQGVAALPLIAAKGQGKNYRKLQSNVANMCFSGAAGQLWLGDGFAFLGGVGTANSTAFAAVCGS